MLNIEMISLSSLNAFLVSYPHILLINIIGTLIVSLNICLLAKDGEIKRLIINIPPRFFKSITVSVAWPAWILGHNPGKQIMGASYSKELAMTHSVNCRNVIESDWYRALFPNTILAPDQNTKNKFKTTQGGCRYAVGVGGTITGEGGNFIVMDDLVSAGDSNSRVTRESANNWIGQTAHNRLNDKHNGVLVLVMQRLHQNDATGFLLEQGGWELTQNSSRGRRR